MNRLCAWLSEDNSDEGEESEEGETDSEGSDEYEEDNPDGEEDEDDEDDTDGMRWLPAAGIILHFYYSTLIGMICETYQVTNNTLKHLFGFLWNAILYVQHTSVQSMLK